MCHGLGAHRRGRLSLLDKRAICLRLWFPGKRPSRQPLSSLEVPGSQHLSQYESTLEWDESWVRVGRQPWVSMREPGWLPNA